VTAGQRADAWQTATGRPAQAGPAGGAALAADRAARKTDRTADGAGGSGRPPWELPGSEREDADWAAGRAAGARLPGRLNALARLTQIGSARSGDGGFSAELLDTAEHLVARAGERLRLSSEHTVVALAGGTGSGKSSLFNRLAGADFSPVGVTRPVTREVHACVWGMPGAGPLLEWLGVPRRYRYARSSPLSRGEQSLTGLVLLDLPDHDTVLTQTSGVADRLAEQADVTVWVLDPQKYADAAVHRRFLVPLAGHSDVLVVVLNQSDLLTGAQIEECLGDLRRLLDTENLSDTQVLVTSAATGGGLDELRRLLADAVAARRAAAARISASLDGVVQRFEPCAGDPAARTAVPADAADQLVQAFMASAGVRAVGDALRAARELRAMDFVGWPIAWLAARLTGRNPLRKIKLGKLWADLRNMTAGPSGAQQAEIDNAITKLADQIGQPLPAPWSRTTRAAVRSRAQQIPAALGAAMSEALPAENSVAGWWRLIGAWQGLLLGAVIVGLAWMATIVGFWVFGAGASVPRVFSDVALLPWVAAMVIAVLVLGWLTSSAAMNMVRNAAERESDRCTAETQDRFGAVARELVLVPAEAELAEFERFRDDLRAAAGRPAGLITRS
jgi:GTP-binding protein EngB required for normal cell division